MRPTLLEIPTLNRPLLFHSYRNVRIVIIVCYCHVPAFTFIVLFAYPLKSAELEHTLAIRMHVGRPGGHQTPPLARRSRMDSADTDTRHWKGLRWPWNCRERCYVRWTEFYSTEGPGWRRTCVVCRRLGRAARTRSNVSHVGWIFLKGPLRFGPTPTASKGRLNEYPPSNIDNANVTVDVTLGLGGKTPGRPSVLTRQ